VAVHVPVCLSQFRHADWRIERVSRKSCSSSLELKLRASARRELDSRSDDSVDSLTRARGKHDLFDLL
jgi:hypothetical protein